MQTELKSKTNSEILEIMWILKKDQNNLHSNFVFMSRMLFDCKHLLFAYEDSCAVVEWCNGTARI